MLAFKSWLVDVLRSRMRFLSHGIVLKFTLLVMALELEAKRRCGGLLGGTFPLGTIVGDSRFCRVTSWCDALRPVTPLTPSSAWCRMMVGKAEDVSLSSLGCELPFD